MKPSKSWPTSRPVPAFGVYLVRGVAVDERDLGGHVGPRRGVSSDGVDRVVLVPDVAVRHRVVVFQASLVVVEKFSDGLCRLSRAVRGE